MMDLQPILDRLDGVRGSGDRYRARCPVHNSRGLTLSITLGDNGKPVIHCFAGCEPAAVLGAIGFTWEHLYPKADGTGSTQAAAPEVPTDVLRVANDLWAQAERYGMPFSELVNARFEDPLPEEAYGGFRWDPDAQPHAGYRTYHPPAPSARDRTRRQVLAVKLGYPARVEELTRTAQEEGWTYQHIRRKTANLSEGKRQELITNVLIERVMENIDV